MNTGERNGRRSPHICQKVLGSEVCDIMDGESCTWGIKRSWAVGMGKDSMWYQSFATLRGRPTLFLFVVAVLDSAAGST